MAVHPTAGVQHLQQRFFSGKITYKALLTYNWVHEALGLLLKDMQIG